MGVVGPSVHDLKKVTGADNLASNGVAHIIDGVLLPPAGLSDAKPNIVELAQSVDDLSTLVAAVVAGDLVETLSSPGPFTVFAPANEAFGALPEGTLDSLLKPENKDQLVHGFEVLPESGHGGGQERARGQDQQGSLCRTQHQRAQVCCRCRQFGEQWCGTHH